MSAENVETEASAQSALAVAVTSPTEGGSSQTAMLTSPSESTAIKLEE